MDRDDTPKVGHVVDHYFLWSDEQARGQVEGRKARPCIILAVFPAGGVAARVVLLPITSRAPPGKTGVSIPDAVKSRLGLEVARPAWVIIDEANTFTWPGFDLVPQPHGGFVRGTVTRGFFEQLRQAVASHRKRGRQRSIDRDE